RRDGSRVDVRRRAARLATELGRTADAKLHLDELMKSSPQDLELMQLRGRCAVQERQFDQAMTWYGKAVKLAPDRVDLAVEYAGVLREKVGAPELADDRINAMLDANKGSPTAQLEGARYFKRAGFLKQAEGHVQAALRLAATDPEVLLLAAD